MTANVATLFFTATFFAMFFLLTLYWEQVRHFSALRTGVAYLPVGLGIGIGIGVCTALVRRFGVRPLLTVGFLLVAAGMYLLSRISVHSAYVSGPLPALVLIALGSGLCFVGFGNASVHRVSRQDASLASGVQNAVQQVGGAVGLAVLATVALRHASTGVRHGLAPGVAATSGYTLAYRIASGVLVVGAVVVAVFLERVGPVDESADVAGVSLGS